MPPGQTNYFLFPILIACKMPVHSFWLYLGLEFCLFQQDAGSALKTAVSLCQYRLFCTKSL